MSQLPTIPGDANCFAGHFDNIDKPGKKVIVEEVTNTIFGEWLARTRTIKGLTLAALSERSGLDIKTLHYWERGKVGNPQPSKVDKLAIGLGIESEVIRTIIADSRKLDELDFKA